MDPVQVAIMLNMVFDLYLKLKKEWPEVQAKDIKKFLESLEAQADVNDSIMGIK